MSVVKAVIVFVSTVWKETDRVHRVSAIKKEFDKVISARARKRQIGLYSTFSVHKERGRIEW